LRADNKEKEEIKDNKEKEEIKDNKEKEEIKDNKEKEDIRNNKGMEESIGEKEEGEFSGDEEDEEDAGSRPESEKHSSTTHTNSEQTEFPYQRSSTSPTTQHLSNIIQPKLTSHKARGILNPSSDYDKPFRELTITTGIERTIKQGRQENNYTLRQIITQLPSKRKLNSPDHDGENCPPRGRSRPESTDSQTGEDRWWPSLR
jgi:hypothetical protein